MLKFPRFEQWACTDKSVNVKALLVSGSYAEGFEGELIIISKINLRAVIEPAGGLQKPDRFIDRREEWG